MYHVAVLCYSSLLFNHRSSQPCMRHDIGGIGTCSSGKSRRASSGPAVCKGYLCSNKPTAVKPSTNISRRSLGTSLLAFFWHWLVFFDRSDLDVDCFDLAADLAVGCSDPVADHDFVCSDLAADLPVDCSDLAVDCSNFAVDCSDLARSDLAVDRSDLAVDR